MSDRTPAADVTKVLLSLAAGPLALGMVLLLVVVAFVGVCGPTGKPSLQVARDTVRIADTVERVQWDTVIVHQRRVDTVKLASDRADSAVTIASDSSVIVRDTIAIIPPEVITDLAANRKTVAAQDTLIRHLYGHDTTQQWRIATRDKFYAASLKQANGPRWGLGATCGLDPFGGGGRCVIGVSYQAKIPSPKALLRALFE